MTEHINTIITLGSGQHIFLQSLYNDTNADGEPIAGNSYYVGYGCANASDTSPAPGHQPGQVYPTNGIATIANAAEHIQLW